MILKWIMKEMVIPTLVSLSISVFLIFSVMLPMGSMFGIAYLVDTYGDGWAFLFIPWVFLLPIILKPLGFMFDCAGGKFSSKISSGNPFLQGGEE